LAQGSCTFARVGPRRNITTNRASDSWLVRVLIEVHEPLRMDANDNSNAAADRSVPVATARHRLLIVEDEAVIRFVLRCEFEQRGFAVTEVEDGARALEIFMREPDAWTGAFVDFLLPDTHGDELIERLLALRPDLPVVLMT